ncbi:TPA: hypothetical protein N0F65_002254 [Lagenidium giganteum]|uniref:Uncharacterized protein n=1 Tax=Lagenidium giganteum TaxID=4803 RepID=A0AAV2YNF6_9STRA|nr:TPA: hypothetical protein N0F65_002254 [Lagenidium giganteum]
MSPASSVACFGAASATGAVGAPSTPSSPRAKPYDEHLLDLAELERRLDTNHLHGLPSHVVARIQSEDPQLNLLPTDMDVGHGSIHELVQVLRDGNWIHTRAENLLPGDVISLKEGQCVPADVRIIEATDMWVDQSVLLGKREPEPRVATSSSVFDAHEDSVPYMQAQNIAFYGTTITKGHGQAIVIRTGANTVLGSISAKLAQKRKEALKCPDVKVTESMKQFDMFCKNDRLPSSINRVSAMVVEHADILKRTVVAISFGVSPPVVVEVEDVVLANDTATEDLEREIALQMLTYCHGNEDAHLFTKALAACRHRVEAATSSPIPLPPSPKVNRVPTLPRSSHIAPPVVIDSLRDQNALLRFASQFTSSSPRNSATRRTRISTLLHGQISGCEVYVHFDQEHGAHVVLLQGPTREILSRCGKVRREGNAIMSPLETQDLQSIQTMVLDLEARGQTVVSFAELYLDPAMYPVGVEFDIENFNFPTSNMCYLGSIGLIEKLQPDAVAMATHAHAADVRLLIPTLTREYPAEPFFAELEDDDTASDDPEAPAIKPICKIPLKLREASTGELYDVEASVFRSNVISVSNTLGQWRNILMEHPVVVFDGCSPAQVDLLVETLQELGECVGLVASGSANALAISSADIGFCIPTHEIIDLSEEAADVVLGNTGSPRTNAIRMIEVAKKIPGVDGVKLLEINVPCDTKATFTNLLRETISVGRLLGLSDLELRSAFDSAVLAAGASTAGPQLMWPSSPSKFPPSAFRSAPFLTGSPHVGAAALSAAVAGVGHAQSTNLSSLYAVASIREQRLIDLVDAYAMEPPQANPSSRALMGKMGGWKGLHRPSAAGVTAEDARRPSTASPALTAAGGSTHSNNQHDDGRRVPNEAIFNTQFTTAGRMFLTKAKRNRAMQVDRRTKGFQLGVENKTMVLDPTTERHYRILLVDPDMQRREDLADGIEQYFETLVAATNERALALLAMFKVDCILLRVALGNDHSEDRSAALEFLRDVHKKHLYRIPVTLMVSHARGMEKLLAHALNQGACGYFEDNLDIPTFIERLGKLLHSLVVSQSEVVRLRGKTHHDKEDDENATSVQAIKRSGTVHFGRRPATSKPSSVVYDQQKMLLELSLNQRKQCLLQRQTIDTSIANSHTVLGLGLRASLTQRSGSLMYPSASSPTLGGVDRTASVSISKKIPPLPSPMDVSKQIFSKPHEIQDRIAKHIYENYHHSKNEPVPQDPLLYQCIAINPESIFKSAGSLYVGKAFHLYEEKRYQEALIQCNRAIKMQGNNMVKLAYLLRGVLYDIIGKFAKAEREFLQCIKLDDQFHQAFFNLSVCRLKMGKDEEALHDVSMALTLDPLNEKYLKNRALIYRRMGEFQLAQDEYSKLETIPAVAKVLTAANAMQPPASSFAKAASSAALLMKSIDSMKGETSTVTAQELEDGLFDHLFGKPTDDKLALVCDPEQRTDEQLNAIVARLQTVLYFQDFPVELLFKVARHMEYEVVACGKSFALGEDHPHNFYVLFSGRLSVRRKLSDFASSVTTHHMGAGLPFGCAGYPIAAHSSLIADESTEVGILWPDVYDTTIRQFCTERNTEIFEFLQQMKAFKLFTTSELGHIIGISERKRYRKGEIILEQNEVPKALFILRKGTCLMFQDFQRPPLAPGDGDFDEFGVGPDGKSAKTIPFHRLVAQPSWPLGYQMHRQRNRRHARGVRRDAVTDSAATAVTMPLIKDAKVEKLAPADKNALIQTLVVPAIFGESAFLDQRQSRSKCTIIADSIVDVVLFDHLRLQEMDLAPEVIRDILDNAPKYLEEKQVVRQKAQTESWNEYKNLRVLELSKARWPEAQKHLRLLSNGCSVMLGELSPARRPPESSPLSVVESRQSVLKSRANFHVVISRMANGRTAVSSLKRHRSAQSLTTPTALNMSSEGGNLRVYNFEISQYKNGKYRFIAAAERDRIQYSGRFLFHGADASRKTKVNAVQFDWPATSFTLRVRKTRTVAIRLKGDGNYFNVFVNGKFRCILRASINATCCEVAEDLDPNQEYVVTISKRTEPQMRGAMSTFKVCTFYGFIVEEDAVVLPCRSQYKHRIEFIGDSDTCAFGNEGKVSSSRNMFGLKGRMENVYNGYACITARMLNAEAHVLAWSGKGVHSNSADWGPNMPALWKNTLASRDGEWDMASWVPDAVVINLGGNDLFPPASSEAEIVDAYASLLEEVRWYRPDAHIFCVVCDEGCMSSDDSEINRSHVSMQLQQIVKVALTKVNKNDNKMHFTLIKVDGGLQPTDYAMLMHYAVSGHQKIAKVLAEEIALRTQWRIEEQPYTMPYPQEKKEIMVPREESRGSCCIS